MQSLLIAENPVNFDEHINFVNSSDRATWKAGKNDKFEGASYKEIRSLLGTVVDSAWTIKIQDKKWSKSEKELPVNFDARV